MPTVFDVARYILERSTTPITTMKLQKLCYYAQAWSLVWEEEPLFNEKIEAWVNGPVIPDLYAAHKGLFKIESGQLPHGDSAVLTTDQKETIDTVIKFYSSYSAQKLSDLTHMEAPWRDARRGLAVGDRGESEITHEQMFAYYASLQ